MFRSGTPSVASVFIPNLNGAPAFGKEVGTVHGPYMAISPTNRCAFLNTRDQCRFCGVGEEDATHGPVPVDDVIEAIRIARSEHPIDMIYLSVGDLGTDDGGVRFLEPYVAEIKKHFDVLVAVDALPLRQPVDRPRLRDGRGLHGYNLEIFDEERFHRICPGPARAMGATDSWRPWPTRRLSSRRGARPATLSLDLSPLRAHAPASIR